MSFFRFILLRYHYCTENFQLYSSSVVPISDMYIFVWFDAWQFIKKMIFWHNVCKTWKYLTCCYLFYILPPWGDNNTDVQNDFNIARSEEVYTSDHSDEFETSQKTCLRWKYISIFSSFFKIFISIRSQEINDEIKVKKEDNITSLLGFQLKQNNIAMQSVCLYWWDLHSEEL